MIYEQRFAMSPLQFLGRYALIIKGAMGDPGENGGTVEALLNAQAFATTQRGMKLHQPAVASVRAGSATSGVSLDAPLLSPWFHRFQEREHSDVLGFSHTQIEIRFADYQATELPVYLIPYRGSNARGVKLPGHGDDAYPVAYAMTALINGCTIEVRGTAQECYASHTNVRDVVANNAQVQAQDRAAKINERLNNLQLRFAQAELASGGNVNALAQHRRQFGFYPPAAPGGVSQSRFLNYRNRFRDVVLRARILDRREENTIGHTNYVWAAGPNAVQFALNGGPQASIVGRRDQHGWAFYYQIWAPLQFALYRHRKVGGVVLSVNRLAAYDVTLILDHGEFWPRRQSHDTTFNVPF